MSPFDSVECSSTQKPHISKSIKNSTEGYVVGREGEREGEEEGGREGEREGGCARVVVV